MTSVTRLFFTASLTFIISFAHSAAVNQVRVYVPAQNGFDEQQLQVGLPGKIFVEVTNDVDLITCEIPIELSSESGATLWPLITEADVMWESFVIYPVVSQTWQDGTWPDTTVFVASFLNNQQPLAPGTTKICEITVIPTDTGLVHLTSPTFSHNTIEHYLQFHDGDSEIVPTFIGPDIEILPADCNSNGIPDDIDILNETSADCNANGIPDECDISYGLALDCNENGLIDSCDVASGFSQDWNTNNIPDECEVLADSNYVLIYAPEADGHAEGELWLDQPQEIFVKISTVNELNVVEIPIAITSPDGTRLWEPITTADITTLVPLDSPDKLIDSTITIEPTWPDTTYFVILATVSPLPMGTYDLFKITVTPLTAGTVEFYTATFDWGSHLYDGPVYYYNGTADSLRPAFFAPDITIGSYDCNLNQIADEYDIGSGYSSDCNSNAIPDECETDCNNNNKPDDCDITDGISFDENDNGIPDECESQSSGCHVRVHVPAGNGHSAQQLVLGQSEEIFVEISLDRDDIINMEIPLLIQKLGGGNLWNSLVSEDITFLPASSALSYFQILHVQFQDGISSDTLLVAFLGDAYAPVGTADWFKITVMPTELGILSFSAPSYLDSELTRALGFYFGAGDSIVPQFICEDITVIAEPAGGGCCLDGYSGNIDCDPEARRNLTDITRLIDYVYVSKDPLCCIDEGNVEGDAEGRVNLADITRLIDHVYVSKEMTAVCP